MRKIDNKKVMECERLQEWLKENPKREVGETIWQKEKRKLKRLLKSLGVVKPFNTLSSPPHSSLDPTPSHPIPGHRFESSESSPIPLLLNLLSIWAGNGLVLH